MPAKRHQLRGCVWCLAAAGVLYWLPVSFLDSLPYEKAHAYIFDNVPADLLTAEFTSDPSVCLYHMACKVTDTGVLFLYLLKAGACPKVPHTCVVCTPELTLCAELRSQRCANGRSASRGNHKGRGEGPQVRRGDAAAERELLVRRHSLAELTRTPQACLGRQAGGASHVRQSCPAAPLSTRYCQAPPETSHLAPVSRPLNHGFLTARAQRGTRNCGVARAVVNNADKSFSTAQRRSATHIKPCSIHFAAAASKEHNRRHKLRQKWAIKGSLLPIWKLSSRWNLASSWW